MAVANVKKQEDAEARFNQPGTGRKVQTFPMSTGDLAKEMQAAPLTRSEKKFRAEDAEELPEIKKRKLGLPPWEVRRQEKKRLEKAKKKKDKKKDQKSKKKEGKDESSEKDQEEEDENESPEEDKEEKEEGPEKDQEEEDLEKEEDEEMDKEESGEPELMEENEGDEDEEDEEGKDWQEWNPKAGSAGSARGWGPSGWYRRQQSHFWSGQYPEGKWELWMSTKERWEIPQRKRMNPRKNRKMRSKDCLALQLGMQDLMRRQKVRPKKRRKSQKKVRIRKLKVKEKKPKTQEAKRK